MVCEICGDPRSWLCHRHTALVDEPELEPWDPTCAGGDIRTATVEMVEVTACAGCALTGAVATRLKQAAERRRFERSQGRGAATSPAPPAPRSPTR